MLVEEGGGTPQGSPGQALGLLRALEQVLAPSPAPQLPGPDVGWTPTPVFQPEPLPERLGTAGMTGSINEQPERAHAWQAAKRLWNPGGVGQYLGGGNRPPSINFAPSDPLAPQDSMSAGLFNRGVNRGGVVNMPAGAMWAGTPYDMNSLVHEWAHLYQTPTMYTSPTTALRNGASYGYFPQAEGGATAFADWVTPRAAQKAGFKYNRSQAETTDPAYIQWKTQALLRGLEWILYGQFGRTR